LAEDVLYARPAIEGYGTMHRGRLEFRLALCLGSNVEVFGELTT
jgi:hypothetical protein